MLTINNTISAQPKINIQKSQTTLKSQLSQKDSLAFKAREESFLKNLRELCKRGWNEDLVGTVEILAHDVNPKHAEVLEELEKIKNNPKIEPIIKKWVSKELLEEIGAGGNIVLGEAVSLKDLFGNLFSKKKKN